MHIIYVDCNFSIRDDSEALEAIKEKAPAEDRVNFETDLHAHSAKVVVELLKKGLGKRILSIAVRPREVEEWGITDPIPSTSGRLYIGFNLDPGSAFGIITKGPMANLPEVSVKMHSELLKIFSFRIDSTGKGIPRILGPEDGTSSLQGRNNSRSFGAWKRNDFVQQKTHLQENSQFFDVPKTQTFKVSLLFFEH